MSLWTRLFSRNPSTARLRHEFAIGPLRPHPLFAKPARTYSCARCKWTFLVGGRKVAVLNEHGTILANAEGEKRYRTLADGPCPVLEALVLYAERDRSKVVILPRRESNGSRDLAAGNVYFGARRARPVFSVLHRLPKDLGAHT